MKPLLKFRTKKDFSQGQNQRVQLRDYKGDRYSDLLITYPRVESIYGEDIKFLDLFSCGARRSIPHHHHHHFQLGNVAVSNMHHLQREKRIISTDGTSSLSSSHLDQQTFSFCLKCLKHCHPNFSNSSSNFSKRRKNYEWLIFKHTQPKIKTV